LILALDNFDIATKIKGDLQRRGIDVFSFTDPGSTSQHFKINAAIYGLIMSDIKMPRMDGFEFVSNVKKIRPDIKVFLMSQIRDIEYSNFLPPTTKIDEFIQKPISIEMLDTIIKKHVDGLNSDFLPESNHS
jgi:DNA-binding NtrC family response regulator